MSYTSVQQIYNALIVQINRSAIHHKVTYFSLDSKLSANEPGSLGRVFHLHQGHGTETYLSPSSKELFHSFEIVLHENFEF